ncbi:MAG: ribbon-helix-helix protein, CopG family [Acidimicrobiales bacterium]|nr:ribbon-helix-helix protein, CopG family [Acidimicrobiales bacterium]
MPDILIRDVPEDVIAQLDQRARHLGLSRTEYLRRMLVRESVDRSTPMTVDHWRTFAERHPDLDDPDVMGHAWA